MNKKFNFLVLFDQFIAQSKSGKRLKKNGLRIRKSTIAQYVQDRNELLRFSLQQNFGLILPGFLAQV